MGFDDALPILELIFIFAQLCLKKYAKSMFPISHAQLYKNFSMIQMYLYYILLKCLFLFIY